MLIIPLCFARESAKSILPNNSKIRRYFEKGTPKPLKTRQFLVIKLKIKIGFVLDRGRDFCISLDFSVHLLFSKCSGLSQQL